MKNDQEAAWEEDKRRTEKKKSLKQTPLN